MAKLRIPVSEKDHKQGSKEALFTLVEYGDYQCPSCREAYPIVKKVQKHFGDQLLFVFRNFPLAQAHPFALDAAETAEFAATYGKFWEMHDLLYENQEKLNTEFLLKLASKLNLSSEELKKVINEKKFQSKIQKDFSEGVRSGVNGTPTFFINEERYEGEVNEKELISYIESLSSRSL